MRQMVGRRHNQGASMHMRADFSPLAVSAVDDLPQGDMDT